MLHKRVSIERECFYFRTSNEVFEQIVKADVSKSCFMGGRHTKTIQNTCTMYLPVCRPVFIDFFHAFVIPS